jgi:hypothetical protein
MEGPQSAIFDQAENRLHLQKAILYLWLGKGAAPRKMTKKPAAKKRPAGKGKPKAAKGRRRR